MAKIRAKTIEIRDFITANVVEHPSTIVALTGDKFDISRQAAARHVRRLVDEGMLEAKGTTRNRKYDLAVLERLKFTYDLSETTSEDTVWNHDLQPIFEGLPANVVNIWHTGFTEMFNNVIDHSDSKTAFVAIDKTAVDFRLYVADKGVGIFKKIQDSLKLTDERHAALELAKGKFTTDPDNHTGMGIFFSYNAFDEFTILSGKMYFNHNHDVEENWLLDERKRKEGTTIILKLNNEAERTMEEVYNLFSASEDNDYAFNRTIVPLKLAVYADDKLVSRSQAKRVLVRVDEFDTVYFDFEGVDYVGQGFTDEIFRVFQKNHPNLEIYAINGNESISSMISRVKSSG